MVCPWTWTPGEGRGEMVTDGWIVDLSSLIDRISMEELRYV